MENLIYVPVVLLFSLVAAVVLRVVWARAQRQPMPEGVLRQGSTWIVFLLFAVLGTAWLLLAAEAPQEDPLVPEEPAIEEPGTAPAPEDGTLPEDDPAAPDDDVTTPGDAPGDAAAGSPPAGAPPAEPTAAPASDASTAAAGDEAGAPPSPTPAR